MNKFDALLDYEIEKSLIDKKVEVKHPSVKFKILNEDDLELVGDLYEVNNQKNKLSTLPFVEPRQPPTQNLQRNLARRLLRLEFVGSNRLVEYSSSELCICIENVRYTNGIIECDIMQLTNGTRFREIEISNQAIVSQNILRSMSENRIFQSLNTNLDQLEDRLFLNVLNSQEPTNFIVRENMSSDVIFTMIDNLTSKNVNPQTILLHPMFLRYLTIHHSLNVTMTNTMFAGLDVILNPFLDNKIYVLPNEVGHLIEFNERMVTNSPSNDIFTTVINMRERINMVISKNFSSCRIQNGSTK